MKMFRCLILFSYLFFALACTNEDAKITETHKAQQLIDTSKPVLTKEAVYLDIQPYEGLSDEIVDYIVTELKKVHPNVILLPSIALPKRAYYKPRVRYKADTLIKIQAEKALKGHFIVGLTHKDISTDNGPKHPDWGVMGLGFQPGQACVASTYRLDEKKGIKLQYFKVVIHEIGHTQGLPHCADKTCIMTDAKGKNNTNNEKGFCKKCRIAMEKKGFDLKKFGM